MYKKWLLASIVVAALLIGGNRFLVADLLVHSQEKNWEHALEEKNISFFKNQIEKTASRDHLLETIQGYEKIIDSKSINTPSSIFFSFLGLKKESSVLHSHFGIVEKRGGTEVFLFDTPFQTKIIKKDEKSITLQNTSSVSIPLEGKILLIPTDRAGVWMSENKTLAPAEMITLRFSNAIPENIAALENVTYGFKIYFLEE